MGTNYLSKMNIPIKGRPLSPHLTIYKPLRPSLFSILNRVSGAFLTISLLGLVFFLRSCELHCSANWFFYYFLFQILSIDAYLIQLLFLIITLAFFYHVILGFRHLFLDTQSANNN